LDRAGARSVDAGEQAYDEQLSLISIQVMQESAASLHNVISRIQRNIRSSDIILPLARNFAIALPTTSFEGAQAVARRITLLLPEIACDIQVFHGATALTLFLRFQAESAGRLQQKSREALSLEDSPPRPAFEASEESASALPYLAFLADYPAPRLLHLFPYELACRYQCVPVGAERAMLTLATSRMLSAGVIAHLQEITQRSIFQVRCEISIIDDVLCYWQRIQGINAVNTVNGGNVGDEAYLPVVEPENI
jgi:hypothetical protein